MHPAMSDKAHHGISKIGVEVSFDLSLDDLAQFASMQCFERVQFGCSFAMTIFKDFGSPLGLLDRCSCPHDPWLVLWPASWRNASAALALY